MKRAFPKDITDSMRDCLLSILWARRDIVDFFKSCGCTSQDVSRVKNFKENSLSRAQIVDDVFSRLNERTDAGLGQFRAMLKRLTEWDHFDSYYFDKLKKLDRNTAQRNISHLSQLVEIRDAKIKKQREERERREQTLKKTSFTLEELKNRFLLLYQGVDQAGKKLTSKERGYALELFLGDLCRLEQFTVTEPFRITGEQIDGALKFEGEHYIVEAKWQDGISATNQLYTFAQKVEGKMYGRGIFVSINGYSREGPAALTQGKALRTVLFDGEDLVWVVEGRFSFAQMLDKKVKAAQTKGRIYVRADSLKSKSPS